MAERVAAAVVAAMDFLKAATAVAAATVDKVDEAESVEMPAQAIALAR